jgi:hypothetical protein
MNYCFKYKNRYVKFGSYAVARLVDRPEKATLYDGMKDVERRQKEEHYIDGKMVLGSKLSLHTIKFTRWEELKVNEKATS